eukprot:2313417-Pleurochrysis_carterae.AAC.2
MGRGGVRTITPHPAGARRRRKNNDEHLRRHLPGDAQLPDRVVPDQILTTNVANPPQQLSPAHSMLVHAALPPSASETTAVLVVGAVTGARANDRSGGRQQQLQPSPRPADPTTMLAPLKVKRQRAAQPSAALMTTTPAM